MLLISNLIERYMAGDRERAWTELSKIQLSKLDSLSLAQTTDFVRSVIASFATNVYSVREMLSSHGYRFHFGKNAIVSSSPETLESLDKAEKEIGRLPLVLRCFYEVFEKISFNQDVQQTLDRQSFFAFYGNYSYFVVNSPRYALERWDNANKESFGFELTDMEQRTGHSSAERFFETGLAHPWDPAGIKVPCDHIDCEYYYDYVRNIPVTFLEEMRMNISFAGFKGFFHLDENDPKRLFAENLVHKLPQF